MNSKPYFILELISQVSYLLMLGLIKAIYYLGIGLIGICKFLKSLIDYVKYLILRSFFLALSKFRDKVIPEFKQGDYCFFLDRSKKELIPVKIMEVRWEHNHNYDLYLKGEYKTLIGYHIVELKVEDNSKLWGKLASPIELVKIKDEKMIEIFRLLYDRE